MTEKHSLLSSRIRVLSTRQYNQWQYFYGACTALRERKDSESVDFRCSQHTKIMQGDLLISLSVVIVSIYIFMSNHHVLYFKYITSQKARW